MSEQNVAILKDAFAQFEREGVFPLETLDPEVEIINFDSFPVTRPYRGWAGLGEWLAEVSEPFDDFRFALVDVLSEDDKHVVWTARVSGKSKTGGPPFSLEWGVVTTFRDDKVVRIEGFRTAAEALEAAGLSE